LMKSPILSIGDDIMQESGIDMIDTA
jgi:hypothetical protein